MEKSEKILPKKRKKKKVTDSGVTVFQFGRWVPVKIVVL